MTKKKKKTFSDVAAATDLSPALKADYVSPLFKKNRRIPVRDLIEDGQKMRVTSYYLKNPNSKLTDKDSMLCIFTEDCDFGSRGELVSQHPGRIRGR